MSLASTAADTLEDVPGFPSPLLFLASWTETPEPGKVAVFTGINIPDFKRGPNTGVEVVGAEIIATKALSEKYPALKDLSDSVFNHTKMPQAFEGDDAWYPRRT